MYWGTLDEIGSKQISVFILRGLFKTHLFVFFFMCPDMHRNRKLENGQKFKPQLIDLKVLEVVLSSSLNSLSVSGVLNQTE